MVTARMTTHVENVGLTLVATQPVQAFSFDEAGFNLIVLPSLKSGARAKSFNLKYLRYKPKVGHHDCAVTAD